MFFDKMAGMPGGAIGGMGGSPGGLSSGGMNQQSLAALMGMFGGGGGGMMGGIGGGPSLPSPPARGASGPGAMPAMPAMQQAAAPGGGMPAAAVAPQQNLMQMLSKMDPARLRELLASLGIGGNGVGAAGSAFNAGGGAGLYNDPGGMMPPYTGGLY